MANENPVVDREAVLRFMTEQRDYMEDRIEHGIETNRKGFAKLRFMDANGNPINNVKLSIKQKNHAFKFGCNIFKYKGFKTEEENALYEERFKKLFNLAVVPFYWSDFEPEEGKMRFDKDSVFIDRRPPSEPILEFCRENNIEPKGHPLFWGTFLPKWLPKDFEQIKPHIIRRLKAISERYDGVIPSFDCVNEVMTLPILSDEIAPNGSDYRNSAPVSEGFPEYMFKMADRFFPGSRLILNEAGGNWGNGEKKRRMPFYMLVENLLLKGCRIDEIGLQYHIFSEAKDLPARAKSSFNPKDIYTVLDTFGEFNKPISISEITVNGYDEELQEKLIYNLYRMWFSHAAVSSIVYWNLGENGAIENDTGWSERQFKGGLIRDDFSERPAYKVLDRLINHEWKTNIDAVAENDYYWFKGFYGDYEIVASANGKEVKRDIRFTKTSFDEFNIIL